MKKARSRSASQNSLRRHWNHVSRLEMLEGREMLNATNELVSLRLAATDLQGNVITQIEQGEAFLIKAYIDDRRDEPGVDVTPVPGQISDQAVGFFTAYFNVTFDRDGFEFDPTYGTDGVKFGPNILSVFPPAAPNVQYDGYIERLGVQNLFTTPIPGEMEILSFRMIAQATGNYDMAEAFIPHFHFDVLDFQETVSPNPEDWPPIYVDGVPQLERLTGQAFTNAVQGNDEYISLYQYNQIPLTQDGQVYFQGIDLEVIASADTDYQLAFVTSPTPTVQGELPNVPTSVDTIDEWSYFYVEVYAKAPAGNAVQAGFVELSYNPDDFKFVSTVSRSQDSTNIKYSITSTVLNEENGTIRIGYNTLATNLGDDGYALIGRIQMKSAIELPVDYTNGELTFTPSSEISLTDTNATVYNKTTFTSAVINGSATASHNFEVWPVIYDVGVNSEDRKIDVTDFAGFIGQYGKLVNDNPQLRKYDFNNNGKVDIGDFSLFIQNYGKSDKSPSTRIYPAGYPGDLGGAPLQGSSFVLEGEYVAARSTPQTTTTTTTASASTEDQPTSLSSQYLVTTMPLTQSTSTGSDTEATSQDNQVTSPVEESTDAVISSLDDQTNLIVMTSQDADSSFASDEDESEFAEQADEVLAIWEDETTLQSVS